jgi:arylsulfatase A-like enzyme
LAGLLLLAVVAALQILAASSDSWALRLSPAANAWSASFIAVGSVWLAYDVLWKHSRGFRWLGIALFLVAVPVVGYLGVKLARSSAGSPPGIRARTLASLPAVLAVLAAAIWPPSWANLDRLEHRAPAPQRTLPNIILIVLDTVRADHLSVYGYARDTSPGLRDFARTATLYRNAFATSDVTLTSHASLFTGLYGIEHGARLPDPVEASHAGLGHPLADRFLTLAEILTDAGYVTAAISANSGYLSPAYNLNQGFAYYENLYPPLGFQRSFLLREPLRIMVSRLTATAELGRVYSPAGEVTQRAVTILDRMVTGKRPFFLFLNYMDAHWPYLPPEPFDRLFGNSSHELLGYYGVVQNQVCSLQRSLTSSERDYLVSQYDGAIAYLDSQLQVLLRSLRDRGLYDNSLIAITSDHGEALGDRNLLGHPMSVYQDQLHIPLIIKYPHQKGAHVEDAPASLVDLMPTVLSIVGLKSPVRLSGINLLDPESRTVRTLLGESYPLPIFVALHPRFRRVDRAAIRWPYKWISGTAGRRELYDLAGDPQETRNLYNSKHPAVETLDADLRRWLSRAHRAGPLQPDRDTLQRLKSLGYTQ